MRVFLISVACALALAGCGVNPPVARSPAPAKPSADTKPAATAKKPGGYYLDDGPHDILPANLDAVPDAVPRAEPLHRFANRTYVALGKPYTPQTERPTRAEEGLASWYGRRFHGKKTASGELYDMYAMTAAHPTLPIPSYARVTALNNGKSVVVRINDRGPFHSNRVIDLSYTAAHKLGYVGMGSTRVRVESLDPATYDTQGEAIAGGVYLQLGAFSREDNARALLDRVRSALELGGEQTRLVLTGTLHRVQIGPYGSDEAAQSDRARVRERLQLNAVLVRRD